MCSLFLSRHFSALCGTPFDQAKPGLVLCFLICEAPSQVPGHLTLGVTVASSGREDWVLVFRCIFKLVRAAWMSVLDFEYMGIVPMQAGRGCQVPGAGVTASGEPPDVGVRNGMWVL